MKSGKDFHGKADSHEAAEFARKAAKLEPIKKNGKDKRIVIDDDEDEDEEIVTVHRKESILDYYDDGKEDVDDGDDPDFDDDEEYEDEEEYEIAEGNR